MSDSEENAAPTTSSMVTYIVDKKGHSTSVVWRYFGFLQSDTKQSAVHCKLCRRFVPSKTGNTTNLFHHLKQCHPSEHEDAKKLQSQTSVGKCGPSTSTSATT